MSNKSHQLQPAVQVAQSREDAAARALGEMHRRFTEQQAYMEQLLSFRTEYSQQLQTAGHEGITAQKFHAYMAFLTKLDRSIVQCQHDLQRTEKEFQRKRNQWLTSHAKTLALEKMIQSDHRRQVLAEDRREQADTDERNLLNRQQGIGDRSDDLSDL